MTTRAALHAIIDALPEDALPEAEARLRPLEEDGEAAHNGSGPATDDAADAEPRWFEILLARSRPLGDEISSERPHDFAGRGEVWPDEP